MNDIPNQIQTYQAIGVPGDFASANPRASVLAGGAALIAGSPGVNVGVFAWVDATGQTVTNFPGVGSLAAPDGFVHREQQGLIVNWLTYSGLTIQPGYMVVLHQAGDFL